MSHSPLRSVAADQAADYLDAFRRLNRLIHQGRPFSGHETNCAFVNTGSGRFATASSAVGFDFEDDGRAIAVTDWDHDGDLDVWAVNRTAPVVRYLRNDGAGAAVGLGLRPIGDGANRDAIGARVRVRLAGDARAPLTRTARAGEGYLSDSGRWLHFGLGLAPEIAEVSVRWPDGREERFDGVRPGGRFVLEKGTGRARPAPVRAVRPALAAGPLPTARTGVRLRSPIRALAPAPALPFRSMDGEAREGFGDARAPLLVNLWASWCAPCVGELGAFSREAERWRAAGMRIVALSVDGLDPERETGPADAARVLGEIGFPFETGMADGATLAVLAAWQRAVFGRERPFPVPTSVLLDADGVPAVLYKGAIDPAVLAADLSALAEDPVRFRDGALPERGTWIEEPSLSLAGAVALALVEDGLSERADDYLRRLDALAVRRPAVTRDPALVAARIVVADRALRDGRATDAEAGFLGAVRADPGSVAALDGLGRALGAQGRHAEAEQVLRRAVAADPRHADARRDLAVALATQGRADEAIGWFEEAIRLAPDRSALHVLLGNARMEAGRTREAIEAFETAAALAPTDADVRMRLGSARAAVGDVDGAIVALREARERAPADPTAALVLGVVLDSAGRTAEAVGAYHDALGVGSDPAIALRLAWILATDPDPALRAGEEAERLARPVCEASGWRDPEALDTLAAALAERGRFDEAAATARRAAAAARATGRVDEGRAIDARAAGYAERRPHRGDR